MNRIIGVSLVLALGLAGTFCWRLSHRLTAEDYFLDNVSKIRDSLSAYDARVIIFLGDSITRQAPLPPQICGHPIINAGLSGSDAAGYFSLLGTIGDFRAAAIVVALGTNNARKINTTNFDSDYAALLKVVSLRAPKLVLVGLPPIEGGPEARNFDTTVAERIVRIRRGPPD